MKLKLPISIALLFIGTVAFGTTDPEKEKFDINDYAWIVGRWTGDGFGGTSEEIWSPPSANGTIMGVYRHFKADGSLNFYEFLVLDSTGLRLKHFTPDLVGWETKEDFVTFEMVSFTKDRIELKGLIYERKSETEMEIRLKLKSKEKAWTEVFNMTKQ